jgi:Cys-rich protein (TIGR01571 family)
MKLLQVGTLLLLAFAPRADAATFMAPRRTSLVDQALGRDLRDMPLTKHDKTAGEGYKPGSPLHEKQEDLKKQGLDKSPQSPPVAVKVDTSPVVGSGGQPYLLWHSEEYFARSCSFFVFYVFTAFVLAAFYISCWTSRSSDSFDEREHNPVGFAYGLFSLDHCFGTSAHHGPLCFAAWCCPAIRLADSYSKQPFPLIRNFWVALLLVTLLFGLKPLTYGLTGVLFLFFAVYSRQQIRRKYDLDRGGPTVFFDCLSWLCCPFCTLAQEARQLDFVVPVRKGETKTMFVQ